jgi:hypothetical protein
MMNAHVFFSYEAFDLVENLRNGSDETFEQCRIVDELQNLDAVARPL